MTHVAVVGAGLAGLSCAHALARESALDVVVLEAGERAGGVAGSERVDGFLFERGPNTIQAGSAAFRELCGELGIDGRLQVASDAADARYLFHRGRLRALPLHPLKLFASDVLPLGARCKLATEPFRKSPWQRDQEPEPTLAEFLEERLGRAPTRVLAAAFVRGVYAGDVDALGAKSAFPRLWELVAEHGGIVRGLKHLRAASAERLASLPGPKVGAARLLSFPNGLQELVDALVAALGARLRTRAPVRALERLSDGGFRLRRSDGEELAAERVVLALPAHAAARLLATLAPAPRGADELARLPCASVTLVHQGFGAEAAAALDRPAPRPRGFGYLVPPGEPSGAPRALGTLFVSDPFPDRAPRGGLALTSFYAREALEGMHRDGVVSLARADLARALGRADAPAPRVTHTVEWKDAIPQYVVGHARRVEALERELAERCPGLHLAGSWVAGVGVEHVLARGRAVARELLREARVA